MEEKKFPLHLSQLDVYFDQLVNAKRPHYNTGGYIKLVGILDKERLKEAARSVPQVFDGFKMRFDLDGHRQVFYVDEKYSTFEINEIDFSNHQNPAHAASCWVQEQFNTAFVLTKESLPFEQFLLTLGPEEHWFFNRYHHLVTDGYGFTVWAQYIAKKYTSLLNNDHVQFCFPAYIDEAIRASEYRASENYEVERKYWLDKINTLPPKVLQKKHATNNEEGRKSGQHSLLLTNEQKEQLVDLQIKTNFSLQQLTIAALIVYFGKTTEHEEFVFGVPIHKRRTKQLRNIFGTFSGILPFKGQYQENCVLIDLLRDIKASQKADYRYQNYLISDLSRELKNNSFTNQLFEIVVNYELLNFELNFGDRLQANISHLTSEFEATPVQICWRDFGRQQSLELRIDFQYQFFSKAEAELFSRRILFILEQFGARLERPVSEINILPLQEASLIKETFNNTKVAYPKHKTVVQLFEEQVERTPANVAIRFKDEALRYDELNARANQLAYYLRSIGVKEGTKVPVCIERGIDMITGILGVLKAGGAYVPIDTDYPAERINYLLRDAQAGIVISSEKVKPKLSRDFEIVTIDNEWEKIDKQPRTNIHALADADDIMYVIYTSGSTGIPKGAAVFQRSVVNLLQWYVREFSITASDCNIIISSVGFDLTQKNIFGTLIAGGTITMPHMEHYDVGQILKCIHDNSVTIINCAPSAFYPLVEDNAFFPDLNSLRLVVLGGEPIRLKRLLNWISVTGNCEVVNSYGPTECTDIASFYRLKEPHKYIRHSMPIGKPNDNVQLYILNHTDQIQPIGVTGEICIAGDSVGAGYLNDEKLTARKFGPNLFGAGKLYRTGDLGRWLTDGNIEFIGRTDDQVKIRGHRIETGEITSVLQHYESVRQAVVVARTDHNGYQQLIAYVVPEENFNRESLLSYLKGKLPEYMVPSILVELESMPLSHNGKIDKNALPDPQFSVSKNYVAPRNEIEQKLVEIWSEVLNIESSKISMTDNFFSLGGHSLLGVNLMAKISKAFSVEFQITILFECPEIGLLASRLEKDIVKIEEPVLVAINEGGYKPPVFCVPGAGGNVMSFHALGRLLGPEQPFYAFQAPGLNGKSIPLKTVEDMAAKYIKEMQKADPYGPYTLGGYSFGANVVYEMASQLKANGFEISKLIIFDAYEPHRIIGHVPLPGLTTDNYEQNLCKMADIFASLYGKELKLPTSVLEGISREEQFHLLHKELSAIGVEVTPEQVKGFMEVCFANISCSYAPENNELLNVPVVVIKPEGRVKEENSWGLGKPMEKDSMGWQSITNETVKVYNVSGDHWTFLNPPHVQQVAEYLKEELSIEGKKIALSM